jgi:L-iditol 2-dehydrogenase
MRQVSLLSDSSDTHRLRLAEELGVHYTVDIEEEDAVQQVRELTGGYGADIVLECSGVASAARMALEMVRKRGKYTQMGLFGRPIEIDFEQIAFKEIQVNGFVSQRRPAWERALALMKRGVVPTERLISHEFRLSKWQEAFEMFEKREGVKLLLLPE